MLAHRRLLVHTGTLILALAGSLTLQGAPVTCAANAGAPPITRVEGLTEPLADYTLQCTGGTPTPLGLPVPQVNITLFLNTNATSHVLAPGLKQNYFNEALILVDEPNSINLGAQRPLLNCGQTGAPDNGPSGPGVCEIISTGNPAQTYDGFACSPFVSGPPPGYGCGRPNAFQGRLGIPPSPTQLNAITFLGVPFDPPGAGTRLLRITNLRGNAVLLGGGQIMATVQIQGAMAISISNPSQIVSFNLPGLAFTAPPALPGIIRVTEGFASSFKDRNVAFTVGNIPAATPGNATYIPPWTYANTANYPVQVAQNVPGTFYNTEDLFQWQPPSPGLNDPPSPNPPISFGIGPVANIGHPLKSGIYNTNTGIAEAGVSSQGTRIALQFTGLPAGVTVVCRTKVPLRRVTTTSPNTGILSMTTTDANGAGPYTPVAALTGSSNTNLVVYEVLYADPFSIEFADIKCSLFNPFAPPPASLNVSVIARLAPFYSSPSAGRPTPTLADPAPTALPRFGMGGSGKGQGAGDGDGGDGGNRGNGGNGGDRGDNDGGPAPITVTLSPVEPT